jgi:Protein of unknown function (DUF4229)
MRAAFTYTSARVLLLVVTLVVLYLTGARGLLLIAAACLVSGIASFVLLSKQRDVMSGALMARIRNRNRPKRPGLRARLEEGARAEDDELQPSDHGFEPDQLSPSYLKSVVPLVWRCTSTFYLDFWKVDRRFTGAVSW